MVFAIFILFTASYFLHLTSRIPALGLIRFDFILIFVVLGLAILSGSFSRYQKNLQPTRLLLYLLLFILVTIPFVEWPGSVINYGIVNFSKVAIFFFFITIIIDTEKRLKIFVTVFLLCQTFRILEPVFLHITTGYWGDIAYSTINAEQQSLNRLSGAPHDVVNANQFAWVINSTLPFIYYLLWQSVKTLKILAILLFPIFVYALLLTGSRSGLLSLLLIVIIIMLLGKNKSKKIIIGTVIFIPMILFIAGNLSPELGERYLSIIDRDVAGGASAAGRVTALSKNFSTVSNKPFIGHGLGTSQEISANFGGGGRAMLTHDLYVEVLQELGLAGFIIFALYIKAVIISLLRARRILMDLSSEHSWLLNLVTATLVWLGMHLFYSLSCFGLSSWEWYLFGGIATVCLKLAQEYASNEDAVQLQQL
ncbi:MAG: O-antigen ligase family protein [Proteobacteria bacterium]|nr:O-antigen ligase family protein [Pseudomonadota bacterium]